ncbi:MAG: hypothetical protein DMF82_14170, partial [Acidobacteria bacterium]
KPKRIDQIVTDELKKIRDDHGDPRRTVLLDAVDEITVEDMIAEEDVAISITHGGYIKRTSISSYRAQHRGGRGRMGMRTKDEDFVDQLFIASTHSYVLIFTDRGRVHWLKVHEIPEVGPQGRGKAVVNLVQLQRLTGLERQKIVDELKEIKVLITDLRDILSKPKRIDQIVTDELKKIRDDHGDPRRTVLLDAVDEITVEDMIAEEDVAISITHGGYIKRTSISSYRAQHRGGRGRMGMRTKDEDFVDQLFIASTHSYVLIFTDRGRVHWLKVHEIPEVGPQGRGKAVVNLVQLQPREKIAAFAAVKEFVSGRYVLLATRKGIVKKTELSAFANPRAGGIIALSVEDDDALIEAVLTGGADEILLATKDGMAIHFSEEDVRPMGRAAYGVKGIELDTGDEVVALEVVAAGGTVLTVTANGYGKKTSLDEYRVQSRGGKGLINIKTTGRNGPVRDAHHRKGYDHSPEHGGHLDHRP